MGPKSGIENAAEERPLNFIQADIPSSQVAKGAFVTYPWTSMGPKYEIENAGDQRLLTLGTNSEIENVAYIANPWRTLVNRDYSQWGRRLPWRPLKKGCPPG
jgi:hypothetical protein